MSMETTKYEDLSEHVWRRVGTIAIDDVRTVLLYLDENPEQAPKPLDLGEEDDERIYAWHRLVEHPVIKECHQRVSGSFLDRILERLTELADQVPGRTIKRSECRDILNGAVKVSGYNDDWERGFYSGLSVAGVKVVPDPEPTPRQLLEALIFEKWGDADDAQMITMSILDEFDVSVKTPGGEKHE